MKFLGLVTIILLSGCATSKDYQVYAESVAKMALAAQQGENACFLAAAKNAEGGDNSAKTAMTTQLKECKKEMPKIEPPKKSWFGF